MRSTNQSPVHDLSIPRRGVLKLGLAGIGVLMSGGALAGCAPPATPAPVAATPTPASRDLHLEVNGQQADAYIAGEVSTGAPGVLVLPAWWGLTPWFKSLCDRLAAEGYVALAPNLFGTKTAGTIPEAQSLVDFSDPAFTRAVALAGLEKLREFVPDGGQGVIGFSFGAWWAGELSAARPDDISATVLFYGTSRADFTSSKSAYLGHFAEKDAYEPLDGVRRMEAQIKDAGRPYQGYIYPGTGHWFFEDDRPDAYNADAAALSWSRTLDFLKTTLF